VGASYPSTNDRRVRRTRRILRQALVSLIFERGWEEVSVQDVCERADVGRSTFYTHYADKEDLLVSGLDDLRRVLREQSISPLERDKRPLRFVGRLIQSAFENRHLFRSLAGTPSAQAVLRTFRDVVIDLLREDVAASGLSSASVETSLHFIAAGLVELITWWFKSDPMIPVQDAERLFLQMAMPVLDAARGGGTQPAHPRLLVATRAVALAV